MKKISLLLVLLVGFVFLSNTAESQVMTSSKLCNEIYEIVKDQTYDNPPAGTWQKLSSYNKWDQITIGIGSVNTYSPRGDQRVYATSLNTASIFVVIQCGRDEDPNRFFAKKSFVVEKALAEIKYESAKFNGQILTIRSQPYYNKYVSGDFSLDLLTGTITPPALNKVD